MGISAVVYMLACRLTNLKMLSSNPEGMDKIPRP